MDGQQLASYREGIKDVPGWFSDLDVALFVQLTSIQHEVGIDGDLLEIGVYHGRSAILLGFLAEQGETLHVCDPFDDFDPGQDYQSSGDDYSGLTRRAFERNFQRFHETLPVIHQVYSSDLIGRVDLGGFRFVHVDGGHTYDIVRGDCDRLRPALPDGSIVVFDDYAQARLYGVVAAVAEEITAHGLVPLVGTPAKLYCSWRPTPSLVARLGSFTGPAGHPVEMIELGERRFPFVDYTPPQRGWREEVLPPVVRRSLGRVRRRIVR